MRATFEAIVDRSQFIEAVAPRKRGGIGARTSVPGKTLLYRDGNMLIVDAPHCRTEVPMTGEWPDCMSVRAKALALICPKLKPDKMLSLVLIGGLLIIDNGIFQVPAKIGRAPK